jgi:hypothetical protein
MEEAFETAEKAASFRERPIILSKSDDAISDAEKRADDLLRFLGQEPAQFGRGQSTRAQVAAEGNRPSGVERLEALLEGMARGGRGRGVESRRIDPPLEGVGLPMANPSMQPASGSVAHRPRRLFHYNEEPWWNIADRPRGSGQGGAGFTRGIYGTQRLAGAKDFAQEAPGYLYEMRLMAEPEQILDWTSDITEQSPYAMERLMKILEQYNITEGNPKMGNVLLRLQRKEPELPSVMKREGLAAVEYPSRLTATPPGRRRRHGNAVVWDDDLLEVLRRFPLLRR